MYKNERPQNRRARIPLSMPHRDPNGSAKQRMFIHAEDPERPALPLLPQDYRQVDRGTPERRESRMHRKRRYAETDVPGERMTKHIGADFVVNSLPKALRARLGTVALVCLCDPAKSRNPRCPRCKSTQTLWRSRMHNARCTECGTVF
jgi:hypothetical protein